MDLGKNGDFLLFAMDIMWNLKCCVFIRGILSVTVLCFFCYSMYLVLDVEKSALLFAMDNSRASVFLLGLYGFSN